MRPLGPARRLHGDETPLPLPENHLPPDSEIFHSTRSDLQSDDKLAQVQCKKVEDVGPFASPHPDYRDDSDVKSGAVQTAIGSMVPEVGLAASEGTDEEEEKNEPPTGCFARFRYDLEQQAPASSTLPFQWFSLNLQIGCGCCCAIVLMVLGLGLLAASTAIKEVEVSYKYPDVEKTFSVTEDYDDDTFFWYDVPTVNLNQKRYITNKDPFLFKPFLMGGASCTDAETQAEVAWRRNETRFRQPGAPTFPDTFGSSVTSVTSGAFVPCGLTAVAFFTDSYKLFSSSGDEILLDQSDVVLEEDEDLYEGKVMTNATGSSGYYTIDGQESWLRPSNLDHYKVWMRQPASPRVRHLWARIPGGLKRGQHRLVFTENSAIWTADGGWGVTEKRVVMSNLGTFGNKGACVFLAIVSLLVGAVEAVVVMLFMVLPKPQYYAKAAGQ